MTSLDDVNFTKMSPDANKRSQNPSSCIKFSVTIRRRALSHFIMASRAVARLTKSVLSQSVLPRVLIAKTLSANAGPKERIWSCSKEAEQSQIGLECLKDMVIDGDIQLFDVREPHELASAGKIPKSVNIPCK